MEDRVVLVTGASSGIGAATASHFSKIGYKKLVLVARREDRLKGVKSECLENGAKDVLLITKDLSSEIEKGNEEIVQKTFDHFGRLDIVIANAGMVEYKSTR